LFDRTEGDEKFKFAQLAAAQGERDGFYWLGWCFRDGKVCKKDLDKAKENFLRASELGHVAAMDHSGYVLDESDPQRWRWWGRAAALGASWRFLFNFEDQVDLFNSGSGSAAAMFAIGRALQGYVNEEASTIFRYAYNFGSRVTPAKQAIAFYEAQIKATKDAMRAWTLVGIKLKVVKDVRKLIAKLIWDSREEALHDLSKGEERQEEDDEEEVQEEEEEEEEEPMRAQKKFANEKSIFSHKMASSSSHNNNYGIPLASLLE
jgi:TPR repeat protein